MEKVLTCKICNNSSYNQPFTARERMLAMGDEFEYFECSNCKCIQISEIPNNIDRYYPENYYSYQNPTFANKLTGFRYLIKKSLAAYCHGSFNLPGYLLSLFYENPFTWLKRDIVNFDTKFLDVGCGAGRLLISMQRSGYKNLMGIDPYNKSDIFYDNGVTVYKKDVFELTGKYDVIMLHHSFEHMEFPKDILKQLYNLVNPEGYIIIRIPVANCFAWRKYGSHWVQLDAPRHFFLHTIKSMTLMANECSLKLSFVNYESTAFQFTGSENYLRGLGYKDKHSFNKKQMKIWTKEAKRLNRINDGDSACFYLQRLSE